jgi:hypothetical protein
MVITLFRRARFLAVLLAVCAAPPAAGQHPAKHCAPTGALVRLAGLNEASGLAASRRAPGRLWTHNDSGQPILVSLDTRGTITGHVRVSGAKVDDWEAIATGPCDGGSCLYIGDIGDNEARRRSITVYRVPEPSAASGTATVSGVFNATYPDGAHDAETLLVAGGRLYVVTKGDPGAVAVYAFPAQLQTNATMKLERITSVAAKADASSRITDGSVSPDGNWVVLRSRSSLTFYRAADLLGGHARMAWSSDVRSLKEPQGEGVAFGEDTNTVFLAGESGGKGQRGTFGQLSCATMRVDEILEGATRLPR